MSMKPGQTKSPSASITRAAGSMPSDGGDSVAFDADVGAVPRDCRRRRSRARRGSAGRALSSSSGEKFATSSRAICALPASRPPSTRSTSPLIQDASSDARNAPRSRRPPARPPGAADTSGRAARRSPAPCRRAPARAASGSCPARSRPRESVPAVAHRHAAGKADQAGLRGAVRLVGEERDPVDRRDVHDHARAALDHPRQHRLRAEERRLEVELDVSIPLLLGDLEQVVGRAAAGVVDEHVDPPGAADHARHVGGDRDVRLHGLPPISAATASARSPTRSATTTAAPSAKKPTDRAADSGAAAGDQRRLAFQTSHPFSAPSWRPRMYQRFTMMNAIRPGRIATTNIAAIVGHSHCPKPAFADAIDRQRPLVLVVRERVREQPLAPRRDEVGEHDDDHAVADERTMRRRIMNELAPSTRADSGAPSGSSRRRRA